MTSLKEKRVGEMRSAILSAAERLFSEKGFDAVTMREIAKEAGCSHTTIYIYFKDKEDLLHQFSVPHLEELRRRMEAVLHENESLNGNHVKKLSRIFIEFCLVNRSVYAILIGANAERVDETDPAKKINRLRIDLFNMMKRVLGEALHITNDQILLAYSRIFYYQLYGITATYANSPETTEQLMVRLATTFDDAVEVLLLGFIQKMKGDVKS